MKKNVTKEYLSIPNLLGYFRILLLPVYLYVYVNASSERDYHLAVLSFFSLFYQIFWMERLQDVLIWLQISERYWTPSQTRSHRGAGTEFYIPLSCRCRIAGRFSDQGGCHGRPGAVSDQTGSSDGRCKDAWENMHGASGRRHVGFALVP